MKKAVSKSGSASGGTPLGGAATSRGGSTAAHPSTRRGASEALRARIRAAHDVMTDEEDAAVTAAAELDPDNPPNLQLRRRGRPPKAFTKEKVPLRLDRDVLAHFRASGEGWQTRINAALRKAAGLE